jgi:hypothetical protein
MLHLIEGLADDWHRLDERIERWARPRNRWPQARQWVQPPNCIGRALPVSRVAALAEMIEQLETLTDMRAVSALLCGATAGRVRKTYFG